jgi:hypothetical protein
MGKALQRLRSVLFELETAPVSLFVSPNIPLAQIVERDLISHGV